MQQQDYDRAKARVQSLRGLYMHAIWYVVVNIGLFVLNLIISPDALWFYWVTIFWGLGLIAHAYTVLGPNRPFGTEWEERKIRKELERER